MLYVVAQYSTQTDSGGAAVGLLVGIGLALIFGAWSANASERKGYGRGLGWILGLLLGLIGRIIVGVLPAKRPVPPGMPLQPVQPSHYDSKATLPAPPQEADKGPLFKL